MKACYLIVVFFAGLPVGFASETCAKRVFSALPESVPGAQDLIRTFFKTKQIIYDHGSWDDERDGEFYASNEYDFRLATNHELPVDLVMGFSTNGVWDLAISLKAQAMVIADVHAGPLMTQYYIFESWFRLARTRAEFLAMLNGVPVDELPQDVTTEEIFAALAHAYGENQARRAKYQTEIIKRVAGLGPEGRIRASAIAKYYQTKDILSAASQPGGDLQNAWQSFGAPQWPVPFASPRGHLIGFMARDFDRRYNPKHHLPEPSPGPDSSLFASHAAYEHVRSMFTNQNVLYAHAEFREPGVYQAVAELMRRKAFSRMAISSSNILDTVIQGDAEAQSAYRDFVAESAAKLFSGGVQAPIQYLQTRHLEPPHEYEAHLISSPTDAMTLQIRSQR